MILMYLVIVSMEGYTFSKNSRNIIGSTNKISSASLGYPELIQIKVSGDDEYRYIHPTQRSFI